MRLLNWILALLIGLSPAYAASPQQRRELLFMGRYLPTVGLNFAGLNNLSSQFLANVTLSRTGMAWQTDANGYYTTAPNNLFLNNATLSTQNVTTSAANYIISFYGTGSVVLTGTKSATINGTGANNQVYLAFTATAGTLTATVSGSVTNAVLAQVTYETSPRAGDQVITTSAAYYGPRLNSSGLLIEEARTNLIPNSTVNYSSFSPTAVTFTTAVAGSPDNTASSAQMTETATANQHMVQRGSWTGVSNTTYAFSIFVKYSGRQYLEIIIDDSVSNGIVGNFDILNGTTSGTYNQGTGVAASSSVTAAPNGYLRLTLVGNPSTGTAPNRISIVGNNSSSASWFPSYTGSTSATTYFWDPQVEAGSFATSPIPTPGGSSVTRPADVAQATGPLLACIQGAAFTLAAEGQVASIASPQLVSNGTSILLGLNTGNGRSTQSATNLSTANAATVNSTFRLVAGYGASSRRLVLSGGTLVSDTTALSTHTAAYIGSGSSGTTGFMNGPLAKLACWNTQLPVSTETGFSRLGAPWQ